MARLILLTKLTVLCPNWLHLDSGTESSRLELELDDRNLWPWPRTNPCRVKLCELKLSIDHMCCRQVPLSETTEVARYLSRLLSCDVDSLPTALFVHTYWKRPEEFAATSAYIGCLQARTRTINATRCQSLNPYYCGLRFGEHDDLGRLSICRQLLSSNDTRAAANYAVPPLALTKIINYRACLASIRTTVTSHRLEKIPRIKKCFLRFIVFKGFFVRRPITKVQPKST